MEGLSTEETLQKLRSDAEWHLEKVLEEMFDRKRWGQRIVRVWECRSDRGAVIRLVETENMGRGSKKRLREMLEESAGWKSILVTGELSLSRNSDPYP